MAGTTDEILVTRKLITAALAAVTVLAMSGCSLADEIAEAAQQTPRVSETEDAPAVAPPAAGDVIETVAQKEAAEAAGLKMYPLAEGGIVFDPAQPLPDAVKADIAAPLAEQLAADPSSSMTLAALRMDAAKNASRFTGRTIVLVMGAIGLR